MNSKVFLGFDFGLKRIGVAVGQDVTMTASPLRTLTAHNGKPNWKEVERLIADWQPSALIVGIPLNMDGTEMTVTKTARHFAKQLQQRFPVPVYQEDERLTTKTARAKAFEKGGYKALQKEVIDAVAAKLILEAWMHKNCR